MYLEREKAAAFSKVRTIIKETNHTYNRTGHKALTVIFQRGLTPTWGRLLNFRHFVSQLLNHIHDQISRFIKLQLNKLCSKRI